MVREPFRPLSGDLTLFLDSIDAARRLTPLASQWHDQLAEITSAHFRFNDQVTDAVKSFADASAWIRPLTSTQLLSAERFTSALTARDIQTWSALSSPASTLAERFASLQLDSVIAGLPLADSLRRDFERWQPFVDEFRTAILEKRQRPVDDVVHATLRGIFEAATNIDTDLDSPHKKVAFWIGLLFLVWHLVQMVSLSQKQALA
jgi:hypothetical protein